MKIIYTANIPEVRKQDVCYRDSFLGVISGATSIEIDDDFPDADLVDQAYAFLDAQPIAASIQVGITPELQQVIDDTKAECEKVRTENAALNNQVAALSSKLNVAVASIETLEAEKAAVKKPTAAELKAAKAAEEAKAAEQQPQE